MAHPSPLYSVSEDWSPQIPLKTMWSPKRSSNRPFPSPLPPPPSPAVIIRDVWLVSFSLLFNHFSRVLSRLLWIVQNPQDDLCTCLLDTSSNGIYQAVHWVAEHYKSGTPITLLNRPIPKLKDAKSWKVWKSRLLYYYKRPSLYDSSLFLYCATKHFWAGCVNHRKLTWQWGWKY